MEHVLNEEKAIELAENISPYDIGGDNAAHYAAKDAALDAMDWKDEQFAKEKESFFKEYRKEILDACIYDFEQKKQQWIDKAVDFISKRFYIGINNHITSKENYYSLTELIRDFEQTMKGE